MTPISVKKTLSRPVAALAALLFGVGAGCAFEPLDEGDEGGGERVESAQLAATAGKDLAEQWVARALEIQQSQIQENVPLDRWQRVGSHDAHVSSAYSTWSSITNGLEHRTHYDRNNQHRSVEEQLHMGARTLMLGLHEGADCGGWGIVCYTQQGEDYFQDNIFIDMEISRFITMHDDEVDNRGEVLLILLDDAISTPGAKRELFQEVALLFDEDFDGEHNPEPNGDLIFRPIDKERLFPDRWPTPRELVKLGRRIVISVKDRNRYDDLSLLQYGHLRSPGVPQTFKDWLFDAGEPGGPSSYSVQYPAKQASAAPSFDAWKCGSTQIDGALPSAFAQFEEKQLFDHEGRIDGGGDSRRIDVRAATRCGFSLALDQIEADPGEKGNSGGGVDNYDFYGSSLKDTVWSFAEGEPNNTGPGAGEDCVVMNPGGRWNDVPCDGLRRFACKRIGATCTAASCDDDYWKVTGQLVPMAPDGNPYTPDRDPDCQSGYAFGVPTNGYENQRLAAIVNQPIPSNTAIWLNLRDRQAEGRFWSEHFTMWAEGEPNQSGGNEDCAMSSSTGIRWNDTSCENQYKFACRRAVPDASGTYSWRLSATAGPWKDASCPSGYVFAAPRNLYEYSDFRMLMGQSGQPGAWLNLTDAHEEGYWEEGPDGSYWPWAAGEPNEYGGNEDCAAMMADGRWNDVVCKQNEGAFACRKVGAFCDATTPCPVDLWAVYTYASCGTGYEFSSPQNRVENEKLRQTVPTMFGGAWRNVELNLTDATVEGLWITHP